MFHRSVRFAAALAGAAVALAACGGDEPAAPAAAPAESAPEASTSSSAAATSTAAPTTAPATAAPTPTEPADTIGGETIFVSSFSEMPDECVDLLVGFLKQLEPQFAGIDFSTATMDDVQTQMTEFETLGEDFDEQIEQSGCANYDFAEGVNEFEQMIAVAQEAAPGTVGFLQMLNAMTSEFEQGGNAGEIGEGPQTCEESIAYIDALIAEGKKMTSLPISELSTVQQAVNLITTQCDPQVMSDFIGRADVSIFMS